RRRYGGGEDVGVSVEEMMMVVVASTMEIKVVAGMASIGDEDRRRVAGGCRGRGDGSDDVDGDEVIKMVRVACRGDGGDDVGCGGGWPESGRSGVGKS
nr:hypothetical protein [Tanacetum cinerariifolium]